MDHFGIGQGVMAAAQIYFQTSRRTGRTVSLVESIKAGDRVVFADSREAERVKRLCKERGIDIETIVVDPRSPQRLFDQGSSQGRTIFDHSWVEQFYMAVIYRAGQDIDHMERETSGYGEAHMETQRKAKEMAKFEPATCELFLRNSGMNTAASPQQPGLGLFHCSGCVTNHPISGFRH